MIDKQQKIDAIYEKVANKDLSFGCRIKLKNQEIVMENTNIECEYTEDYEVMGGLIGRYGTTTWCGTTLEIEKIYFNETPYNEVSYDKEEVSNDFKEEFIFDEDTEEKNGDLEIIGHPVMIGDVMEYFYGNVRFSEWAKCWKKLTKPIEDQSDECIDFIYNLIS